MVSFIDLQFWISFFYFFIAILVAFYIPGSLLLRKLPISFFQNLILGIVLGMVMWGWQGMIFGYLGMRDLSYVYLFACLLIWVKVILVGKMLPWKKLHITIYDWVIAVVVLLGTFMQTLGVWFTGTLWSRGLYVCCGNISDSLFHLSLTNQIIHNFPPYQPGMYGVVVHNYHYWSNLVVADLVRVFHLPLMATQDQYIAFMISLFLGLTAVVFSQVIKAKKLFTFWLLLFLYFGGDFLHVTLFTLGKGFNFSMGSLENGAIFLMNPPRAFSIVIFFAGISLLVLWLKNKSIKIGLLMAFLLGSTIGFKVYTGIFALIGLSTLGVYFLLKKQILMLTPILFAGFVCAVIYLPVNQGAGGLYFTGLWIFENFIINIGLERWELARKIFQDDHKWLRVIQHELMYIGLYIFSIFGSKILGLFQSKDSFSKFPRELHIFLLSGLFVSMIGGVFFQQDSGGANSFNFLVSVFIFSSIYAALAVYYWVEKIPSKLKWIAIIFVIVLTVPRVVDESRGFVNRILNQEGFWVDREELQGLKYLNENTNTSSLILVDSRDFLMDKDSPYISFLADRPMFLSGTGILNSHKIDFSERYSIREIILQNNNPKDISNILKRNEIDYIFMSPKDKLPIEKYTNYIKIVYQNKKVKILKVI